MTRQACELCGACLWKVTGDLCLDLHIPNFSSENFCHLRTAWYMPNTLMIYTRHQGLFRRSGWRTGRAAIFMVYYHGAVSPGQFDIHMQLRVTALTAAHVPCAV